MSISYTLLNHKGDRNSAFSQFCIRYTEITFQKIPGSANQDKRESIALSKARDRTDSQRLWMDFLVPK